MTFPSVERDLLMAAPSWSLAPTAPVEFALSLYNIMDTIMYACEWCDFG